MSFCFLWFTSSMHVKYLPICLSGWEFTGHIGNPLICYPFVSKCSNVSMSVSMNIQCSILLCIFTRWESESRVMERQRRGDLENTIKKRSQGFLTFEISYQGDEDWGGMHEYQRISSPKDKKCHNYYLRSGELVNVLYFWQFRILIYDKHNLERHWALDRGSTKHIWWKRGRLCCLRFLEVEI